MAFADKQSVSRELIVAPLLSRISDSYRPSMRSDHLVRTGQTLTNVNDIRDVLIT
jgi:glycerate-2-kinase